MEFYSDEHKAKIARLENLWENLHELADMCKEYGIQDMLQDNGLKCKFRAVSHTCTEI